MHRFPALFSAVVACAYPMAAASGQEPASRVTLEEALALFGQNNPELRLARVRALESEGAGPSTCPECSGPVQPSAAQCPDCGESLVPGATQDPDALRRTRRE